MSKVGIKLRLDTLMSWMAEMEKNGYKKPSKKLKGKFIKK